MPISQRRRRSRDQLLAAIRAGGGVSRADLRVLTGLSRSAVADGVQALVADGARRRGHRAPAARGRPAALLHAAGPSGIVAGIDFGHAHVSVALGEHDRRDRRRAAGRDRRRRARSHGARHGGSARPAAARGGRDQRRATCSTVAAGIPGPLDLDSNRVRSPTILSGWVDIAPDAELERRLGLPVQVANDADMGARGELRFGAARGCRDFMYVKASHGIGAGPRARRRDVPRRGRRDRRDRPHPGRGSGQPVPLRQPRLPGDGGLDHRVPAPAGRGAGRGDGRRRAGADRDQRRPGRGAAAGGDRAHARPRPGRPLQLPEPGARSSSAGSSAPSASRSRAACASRSTAARSRRSPRPSRSARRSSACARSCSARSRPRRRRHMSAPLSGALRDPAATLGRR